MKQLLCTVCGVVGAAVAAAFGGWSAGMTTLLIFMAVDFLTGLVLAGVFHKSKKSASGALESGACRQGLARKGVTLCVVLVACRLDLLLGTHYVRDAVIIAYCASEGLSIVENAALMGVPVPDAVARAIEALNDNLPEAKQ